MLIRRLKIIEGQIRWLRDMIEKGSYCIDVITQSSAIKQALSNVEDLLLEKAICRVALFTRFNRGTQPRQLEK